MAWELAGEFGITGAQAGFVMFDFIRDWQYRTNKSGLKIVDYDNMLDPRCEHSFQKTIKNYTWDALQTDAKMLLEQHAENTDPRIVEHWKSIVDGNVPFGYSVSED